MKLSNSNINITAYLLTFIGYMTLTLSLTLTSYLASALNLTEGATEVGISLSFFTFSLSAIFFATLSDIFTAKRVLLVSQIISISGLLTLGFTQHSTTMYAGFFLLGLGTGCYSSISRALISRNTLDKTHMKRSFAVLSTCIILAPVMSSYLVLLMTNFSWRAAYIAMAILEISLLSYSYSSLKIDAKHQVLIAKKKILTGFTHALSQRSYVINVIIAAAMFSFFLGVLMSAFRGLVADDLELNVKQFSLLFLICSISYIAGIFTFRFKANSSHKKRYNFGILAIIFILVIIYSIFTPSIYTLLTIYFICFFTGFLVPAATGNAMTDISKGHGSAAAMLTFSVAFFMAIWEFIRAHSSMSDYHFILMALWVTFIATFILKLITYLMPSKKP
jgi:MFS family permease